MRHCWSWSALGGLVLGCSSGADPAATGAPTTVPGFLGDPSAVPAGSSSMPAAALDGPGSSSTEGDGSSGMGSEGSMTGNGMAFEGAGALPLANGNNPGPAAQPSAAQPSAAQ